MNARQNEFEYQGMPVRYFILGRGPALLLLHGWGSNAQVMVPLAASLADIRTCFIPDLPGFGATPPPDEPWSIANYADFAQIFTEQVIAGPVDVLAHSFGGRITLKWAHREAGVLGGTKTDANAAATSKKTPFTIQKIIITGGAGMKPKRSFDYYRRRTLALTLKAPFRLLPKSSEKKALEWLRSTTVWKSLGSSDYQKLDGAMRETFVKTVSEHFDHCLPEIPHEILLLWGKKDEATPWYQAERMEKGLANGALVGIDHAGHYAFLDQPDRFQRIARAFLTAK